MVRKESLLHNGTFPTQKAFGAGVSSLMTYLPLVHIPIKIIPNSKDVTQGDFSKESTIKKTDKPQSSALAKKLASLVVYTNYRQNRIFLCVNIFYSLNNSQKI